MEHDTRPVLDYATEDLPVASVAWQSVVAGVGGFVFIPSFMCMCGYLDQTALISTVPALLLAWWRSARRLSVVGRFFAGVVTLLVTAAFIKNLLDIAWFGHNPLFR